MKINHFSEVRTVTESKQNKAVCYRFYGGQNCNCTVVEICKQAKTEQCMVGALYAVCTLIVQVGATEGIMAG
jgi:hypothetical protein